MAGITGRAHAILSASGSERWINCSPSARLEEKLPEVNTDDALEGTLGHDMAKMFLRARLDNDGGVPPDYELATHRSHRLWSADLERATLDYVDYIMGEYARAQAIDESARLQIEMTADFSEWVPEGFGTADATILYGDTLEVIDLKLGQGIIVSAVDNSQARLYALGRLRAYEGFWSVKTVVCKICQPRRDRNSEQRIPVEELLRWAKEVVVPAAERAWKGGGEFVPGDWCTFCKLAPTCAARIKQAVDVFDAIEQAAPPASPAALTMEEIAKLLPRLDIALSVINSLKKYAYEQALAGVEVPGYKLVEGRSTRKYVDDLAVAKAVVASGVAEPLIWTRKLIGVTEMGKVMGKKPFKTVLEDAGLVHKPPGKPTLVTADDPRPAIDRAAAAARNFADNPIQEDENQ